MKDKWKKRFELADIRCREVVDLNSDPVIRYTAVKCSTALRELRDLDKLHYEEIKDLLTQLITECKEMRVKASLEEAKKIKPGFFGLSIENSEKLSFHIIGIGYNQAIDDVLTLLKNKRY